MAIAPRILETFDLPQNPVGPFILVEVANGMSVKTATQADVVEDFFPVLAFCGRTAPTWRVIQESDLRQYQRVASTHQRTWWDGDTFIGPVDYRDPRHIEFIHPRSN